MPKFLRFWIREGRFGGFPASRGHFHKFSMFRAKKCISTTLNLQKSHFSDSFRNSRAARHLPCASTKQPTRCDITPLKKVRSIVDPTTRFRRLYKNISDPGDSEFQGRRNRNQKVTLGRRLAQNDARNAKVRTKSHFRPRLLLTLQCFAHNFKASIFQIHSKMNLEIPRGCRNNRADFF